MEEKKESATMNCFKLTAIDVIEDMQGELEYIFDVLRMAYDENNEADRTSLLRITMLALTEVKNRLINASEYLQE